jgi:hypothetical protein
MAHRSLNGIRDLGDLDIHAGIRQEGELVHQQARAFMAHHLLVFPLRQFRQ